MTVSQPPTPSWYDLLGVDRDATPEEVRTAWRSAIADLDPTDRRFAVLNQAAEVLLDPQARAAYDASLQPAPEPARAEVLVPVAEPDAEPDAGLDGLPPSEPAAARSTRRTVVPAWLLVGLAVVTLVVAGVAGYLWARVPSDQQVEDDTAAALSSAERAVVPILSYDARNLAQSKAAAEPYLTGSYRDDYDNIFDGIIEKNAPSTGTVVKAQLVRSGVVRSGDDRVQVFLLVDQTRTNAQDKQPTIYKNWVTVTMEKVDGDWLVAGMDT